VTTQFDGDQSGTFVDPFGHIRHVATHVEDAPEDELRRRVAAFTAGKSA
jgi:PhnB protein